MTRAASMYHHPGFLPASLLTALNQHLQSEAGALAAIQHTRDGSLAQQAEVRRAWEVDLPDLLHDGLLDRLDAVRADIEAHFDQPLDPCDAVAALRYPPGAFYRSHRDTSSHADAHGLHRRAVSLVLFLNSAAPCPGASFAGGQLRFHEGPGHGGVPHDLTPEAGTLVAFPSGWLHEVRPVAWGTRHAIVAWLAAAAEPAA